MTVQILVGHVLSRLRELPDESVHCVVTSPPYYGLRSYGVEPQVWGGGKDCRHDFQMEEIGTEIGKGNWTQATGGSDWAAGVRNKVTAEHREPIREVKERGFCRRCGAWRGDLGLEPTVELYIAHLVEVFREVRRVLCKDGTLWVNLGDSYAGGGGFSAGAPSSEHSKSGKYGTLGALKSGGIKPSGTIKPKDLLLMPAQLALALRADGWVLRSEIVWAKAAPMPESVTDRATCAHEKIFMLAKSNQTTFWTHRDHAGSRTKPAPDYRWVDHDNDDTETDIEPPNWRTEPAAVKVPAHPKNSFSSDTDDSNRAPGMSWAGHFRKRWSRINLWAAHDYFFDNEAVKEEAEYPNGPNAPDAIKSPYGQGFMRRAPLISENRKDLRSDIESRHRSSIDGGQSLQVKPDGKRNMRNVWHLGPEPFPEAHFATYPTEIPRRAILAGTSAKGVCPKCGAPWVRVVEKKSFARAMDRLYGGTLGHNPSGTVPGSNTRGCPDPETQTIGWRPSCSCDAGDPQPATVLDPFLGSGTTAMVANWFGRDCIGIELNEEYAVMAEYRSRGEPPPPSELAVPTAFGALLHW